MPYQPNTDEEFEKLKKAVLMEKKLEEINPVLIKMVREIVETHMRNQMIKVIKNFGIGFLLILFCLTFVGAFSTL